MNSLVPILLILAATTVYGLWYRGSRGKIKTRQSLPEAALTPEILGANLGSRATLVQFSSAFCTPCRATRMLLENVASTMPDVVHMDIDAEAHLDLVRKLDIRSTPTTLVLNSRGLEVGRAIGAPTREQVLSSLAALN